MGTVETKKGRVIMARKRKEYRISKHRRVDKKSGNIKESHKWNIYFRDHLDIERKLAGSSDKSTTDYIARNLIAIVNLRVNNQPLTKEVSDFIENRPKDFRKKLLEWGILDAETDSNFEPLMVYTKVKPKHSSREVYDIKGSHLFDWRKSMKAEELTDLHIREIVNRTAIVIDGCNFYTPNDIEGNKLKNWLRDLRKKGASVNNSNKHLKNFKTFINWMIKSNRLQYNLVQYVQLLKKTEKQHPRRVLSPDELSTLISTTITDADIFHGLSGFERSLVYRIAIYTGLRHKEIWGLQRKDISFGKEPSITARNNGKKRNNRIDVLPLQSELARDLEQYFSDNPAMPNARAFSKMWKAGGANMLKHDLKGAKIKYETDEGFADFHSLRHNFGSLLAASGVHPKTAQDLMRHSDINLTMSRYTHTLRGQKAKAIEALPKIEINKQKQVKTGTDDVPENLTANLTENPPKIPKNPVKSSKSDFSNSKDKKDVKPYNKSTSKDNTPIRLEGFEPPTFGSVDRRSIQLSYRRRIF